MGKLAALWNLFRKGDAISDPAKWKRRQITTTMLGGAIFAVLNVAKNFGYDLQIDEGAAEAVAVGVLVVVNGVLTLTTSKTVGLPARRDAADVGNPRIEP